MIKKLLTLALVAVMLSTAALAAPGSTMLMNATYAAEEENKITADGFEAIRAVTNSDNSVTLSSGYIPGDKTAKIHGKYGDYYNEWMYVRYDISEFQNMNVDEIESVILGINLRFNKVGTVYVKSLEKNVWDDAVKAIDAASEAAGETVTTATVDATVAAAKFVYPRTDTSLKTLGTVEKSANNYTVPAKLIGTEYTFNTLLASKNEYKVATIGAGDVVNYVKDAVKNKEPYLYFSLSFYYKSAKSESYATFYCTSSGNSVTISDDVVVLYNSVAGNKFNTTITTLPAATDFTYGSVVTPATTNIRMISAIYDAGGDLLDVVASGLLSASEGNLSLAVPLSSYDDAASVKCYLWDGTTLRPYTTPLEKSVVAAATE